MGRVALVALIIEIRPDQIAAQIPRGCSSSEVDKQRSAMMLLRAVINIVRPVRFDFQGYEAASVSAAGVAGLQR